MISMQFSWKKNKNNNNKNIVTVSMSKFWNILGFNIRNMS